MADPWKRKEVIGDATLYLGDCLEVMAAWPSCFRVAGALTDPPFGIGNFVQSNRGEKVCWNEFTPDGAFFAALRSRSDHRVIWGAEHFNCFEGHGALIWDKNQPMPDFSKAEIASKSWGKKTELLRLTWTNFVNSKESDHPCERPVYLYEWCIKLFPNSPGVILDPFAGSGSVGVACMNLGRRFIGIEIEPKYFDIACERIENAQRQQRMFS